MKSFFNCANKRLLSELMLVQKQLVCSDSKQVGIDNGEIGLSLAILKSGKLAVVSPQHSAGRQPRDGCSAELLRSPRTTVETLD